ncbi:GIN domain-containing protein [Novosphingobium nitrogenifigens]|nr:DUF2807 domain-containing protein [Novosphingobium nitrogenifigens]
MRRPCAVLAPLALALAGCDSPSVSINGRDGVTLDRLDLSGHAPSEITLLGPDNVRIVHGDRFDIRIEGPDTARKALRFVLADGRLGIGRMPDSGGAGLATISISDPVVDHLIVAGSGTMSSDRLSAPAVGVTIGGSGRIATGTIATRHLDIELLGSGNVTGNGHADTLALNMTGSGNADLGGLRAETTAIALTGSGTGVIGSGGEVTGSITGSGTMTVRGHARCTVVVTGSGRIACEP